VPAKDIPEGSRFKGYKDFTVQGPVVEAHNIRYLLECWQTPDGGYVTAEPPAELSGRHFSPELIRFVLYQYHHCHVTQPLLLEQLHEFGIDISAGQRSRDTFTTLKKTCRKLGLSFWQYLHDRLNKIGFIPNLADLIRYRSMEPG
jgi:hypothetical protein